MISPMEGLTRSWRRWYFLPLSRILNKRLKSRMLSLKFIDETPSRENPLIPDLLLGLASEN